MPTNFTVSYNGPPSEFQKTMNFYSDDINSWEEASPGIYNITFNADLQLEDVTPILIESQWSANF